MFQIQYTGEHLLLNLPSLVLIKHKIEDYQMRPKQVLDGTLPNLYKACDGLGLHSSSITRRSRQAKLVGTASFARGKFRAVPR
jgi:hypothetical protein